MEGTSSSSVAVGTGSKTFTVPAGKAWVSTMPISIYAVGTKLATVLTGTVTSYSGTSLVMNITRYGPSAGNIGCVNSMWGRFASQAYASDSNTIAGSGTKSWTTRAGLTLSNGDAIRACSRATSTTYMDGTVSSYNSSTGALSITVTGTYKYFLPSGQTGSWSWDAKIYGYVPSSSTFVATGGGRFNATALFSLDPYITQANPTTVAAYATLETWDKLYDYCQYYIDTNAGRSLGQFATKSGQGISIGAFNLIVDASAAQVFSISGSNLTIKATTVSAGATFQGLSTTGTVSTLNGAVINTWYFSSAGTSVLITAPNIVNGSYYQIYNVTDSSQIAVGTVGAGGLYYRTTWTSNKTLRLRFAYVNGLSAYAPLQLTGTLSATGASFIDSQVVDTVYNANAVDGSAVTGITADYAHLYVDPTASPLEVKTIYAWYEYNLMNSSGIASNFFGGLIAQDTLNYVVNVSQVDLKFFNPGTSEVDIIGGVISKSDGTYNLVAAGSGSIIFNPGKAYPVGVSGLTSAQDAILKFIMVNTI